MNLLRKLKRYDVKKLHVCALFRADNLKHKPYFGMIGEFDTTWTPHFLGYKILFGDMDKTLKDPTQEETQYIPRSELFGLQPNKNLYYEKIKNIKHIFYFKEEVVKQKKISLSKIEELNSDLVNHKLV